MATQPNEFTSNVLETEILPEIQSLYFNGFSTALGAGDVLIVLQLNGQPSLVLNTSYTLAKTLAEGLLKTIESLETRTGTKIMTTHVIAEAMSKN